MVNLKRISNSAFTLLALCVAQRLMAQQPFWLPVLAPELGLADKQTAITDGNSLFLNSTEDKLELLFIAELSTKSSSEDDSKEVDTYSEADSLLSSDEQQEKNEDKKNELSASSAFDHLGEQAAPAVDIALPYAAGLFASWLMKLDSSMGMLTAKSITAGLAYVGHHLGQGKNDEGGEAVSDYYDITLWAGYPKTRDQDNPEAFLIKLLIDVNNFNSKYSQYFKITDVIAYVASPDIDSNYAAAYSPKYFAQHIQNFKTVNLHALIDHQSFNKGYNPTNKWTDPSIVTLDSAVAGWNQPNNTLLPALHWFSDVYKALNNSNIKTSLVMDPQANGVNKEGEQLLLMYMDDYRNNYSGDKFETGITLGVDQIHQAYGNLIEFPLKYSALPKYKDLNIKSIDDLLFNYNIGGNCDKCPPLSWPLSIYFNDSSTEITRSYTADTSSMVNDVYMQVYEEDFKSWMLDTSNQPQPGGFWQLNYALRNEPYYNDYGIQSVEIVQQGNTNKFTVTVTGTGMSELQENLIKGVMVTAVLNSDINSKDNSQNKDIQTSFVFTPKVAIDSSVSLSKDTLTFDLKGASLIPLSGKEASDYTLFTGEIDVKYTYPYLLPGSDAEDIKLMFSFEPDYFGMTDPSDFYNNFIEQFLDFTNKDPDNHLYHTDQNDSLPLSNNVFAIYDYGNMIDEGSPWFA